MNQPDLAGLILRSLGSGSSPPAASLRPLWLQFPSSNFSSINSSPEDWTDPILSMRGPPDALWCSTA